MRVPAFPATYMYGRRRLTRLEGALYGIVGAVLLALFADRLLAYMELAEKTAMQATVSSLTSAINARVALAMVQGQTLSPGRWSGRNPFELAGSSSGAARPLGSQTVAELERPSWTYDVERGEIIYLPRLYRGLHTQDPDRALRFRLVAHPAGLGYRLVSTSGYEWDAFQ
jgi:hypothetical protein